MAAANERATPFTFTLDPEYPTSAGVYDEAGSLVRTLWRNETKGPGEIAEVWDGRDDRGTPVEPGEYEIRVLFHQVDYVFEGAIGNTSTPHPSPGFNIHGGGAITALAIAGTDAFYATDTDEGRTSLHYFDTRDISQQSDMGHKDFVNFFDEVATDGDWVYFASRNTGWKRPKYHTFVTAFTVRDRAQALFKGDAPDVQAVRTDGDGANPIWPSCIDVETAREPSNRTAATGLAVQRNGRVLAVAHGPLDEVRLFDKRTGQRLGTIAVKNPDALAMAPDGDLWIISGAKVLRYTALEKKPRRAASIEKTVAPVSVSVHPADRDVVLVADGGESQTVKAFRADGKPRWEFGQPGGWYAKSATPEITFDKFGFGIGGRSHPLPRAPLAVQPDGSFWIGDGATSRLLHFSAAREYLGQIAYLSRNNICTVDPHQPTRVFADDFLEFEVDYTRPLDDPASWRLTKNWAAGQAPRYLGGKLGGVAGLRHVTTLANGRTYALLADFAAPDPIVRDHARQAVVELPARGPLRPTGKYVDRVYTAPAYYEKAPLAQRPSFEANGALRYPRIERGEQVVFYERAIRFDAKHNPIWDDEKAIASAPYRDGDPLSLSDLDPFDTAYPITDSGVLVTFDPGKTKLPIPRGADRVDSSGFHLGGLRVGQSGWAWKASPAVRKNVPFDGKGSFDIGDGVEYAGGTVTASGRNVVYSYLGEFWNQTEASQWMHFRDDGLFVGQFGTTGDAYNQHTRRGSQNNFPPLPGFAGYNGWTAMVTVDAANQPVREGAGGETFVWSNDKTTRFGLVRWHLLGANTIRELRGRGPLGASIALPPAPPAPFPTRLEAEPRDGAVALAWQPAAGASAYEIKYSERSGGPFQTLAAEVKETQYFDRLTNGTRRYYVVRASGSDVFSNQAVAVPFRAVGKTGSLAGGPLRPWPVSSGAVARGKAALRGISRVLGDLIRSDVGASGYVLYDRGLEPEERRNLARGFTVTERGPWQYREKFMMNRFALDGEPGPEAALTLEPETTGLIDIAPGDSETHFLTVFCPTLADHNAHQFTVELRPRDGSTPGAAYTVNDPEDGGDNRIFQFEFRGPVTLAVTSTGTNPITVHGSLQAIFLD